MKEIIVICGTIMLGCFIFGRIYGKFVDRKSVV